MDCTILYWSIIIIPINHTNIIKANNQDHTDYLKNNADDVTSGILTALGLVVSTRNLTIPATTADPYGVIYQGANPLIHSFGIRNFFAGSGAGNFTMTGTDNVGVGQNVFLFNTTGNQNSAMGVYALFQNTSGQDSVAVGYRSLFNNKVGTDNIGVGSYALYTTGAGGLNSSWNSAVGKNVLYSTTSGSFNAVLGGDAMYLNTTGSYNSAIGTDAMYDNTIGSYNSALGMYAGKSNITGNRNVFLGYAAGFYETGSDKLYIANSNTITPLIYGDFATSILTINGDQIIDNTSAEAFLVRKNADAGDVFTVDTSNKRINLYGGGGAGLPTFDFWANWMRVGANYNLPTRTDGIYKNFSLMMAGENSTTKPDWSIIQAQSNPTTIGNFLTIGGGGKGATQIDFYVAADQTSNAQLAAGLRYNKAFGVGNLFAYYPSGSFSAIDGAGIYIFDDAVLGAEMITAAANRQFDAGHNWVTTSYWSVQTTGGNPGGYLRYGNYSGGGTATLSAANLTGQLKANRWYALKIDIYIEDWAAFGPYITTACSAEWQQFTYDSPAWITMTKFFRPIADGVGLVFGWKSSSLADLTRIDNVSLKEMQAGDLDMGGAFHGTGSVIRGVNGYDVDPESDIDTDIITVNVTGAPKVFWDESQDRFSFTKGLEIIDGGKIVPTANTIGLYIGGATDKLSFFNATPIVQPSAYTQTYSIADKTHADWTSADLGVFTGGAIGFLDAVERDNIRTQFNALRVDVADIKQLVNSVIDDLQALGLAQ